MSMDFAEESSSSTAWMLTFGDLLALMLTFFILLYSMSVVSNDDWEDLTNSLSERLNPPNEIVIESEYSAELGIKSLDIDIATDLSYLGAVINNKVREHPLLNEEVLLSELDDRLVISLASGALFKPASAELTQDAQIILYVLGNVLQQIANKIEINGHTDPIPIKNDNYPSNWELSLARAIAVGEELKKYGNPFRIDSFGLASSRYDEIADLDISLEEKHRLSRRIDIVIRRVVGVRR